MKIPEKHNLKDQTFGMLFVIEFAGIQKIDDHHSRRNWLCQCKCGNKLIIPANSLKSGNTKSCGCSKRRTGKDNPQYMGYEEISQTIWGSFKRDAKKRNREFSITIEYVWKLFIQQNRKCAISGLDISFPKKTYSPTCTASLDRIDNKKGYIKGNVQWLHTDINFMKYDHDQEYFISLCQIVANNFI